MIVNLIHVPMDANHILTIFEILQNNLYNLSINHYKTDIYGG